MWEDAHAVNAQPNGRYRIQTRLEGRAWVVIVEPEPVERKILVITAHADD